MEATTLIAGLSRLFCAFVFCSYRSGWASDERLRLAISDFDGRPATSTSDQRLRRLATGVQRLATIWRSVMIGLILFDEFLHSHRVALAVAVAGDRI
jgi:hypothetical protein